ncbi:MAG: ComEC/Rec2 family competence protein [Campylobacteraceae bacterium]|jgi:competence protein ComEC|nr:ComEC/Rec2 family competence protein [Campylobacteraceae bacterium]
MKHFLPLFQTKVEMAAAVMVLSAVFFINIFLTYLDFREFKSHSWATIRGNIANIVHLTSKNNRAYQRLYIKSDSGLGVSVTYMSNATFTQNMRVGFRVKTDDVTFGSFVSNRFWAQSVLVWAHEVNDTSVKSKLKTFITSQHENTLMQELYGALFLATPISKQLREQVQVWGVAHIIAISGFHLGLIFGFLYALFRPLYRFFQDRYFPYRNARWDISLVIFAILGYYLWLIDMTPSFLRSYAMGVLGFLFLWRGINALGFEILFFTSALLIAFFPHLMFNIGFILSVFGVFFIFVFIKHFGKVLKVWQSAALINLWLFFAMTPIVHHWFDVINLQQLASIPLSFLFVVFYPLTAFLHLAGFGGLFDAFLLQSLTLSSKSVMFTTPLWLLGIYIVLSFLCAWKKIFMLPVALVGLGCFCFFVFS